MSLHLPDNNIVIHVVGLKAELLSHIALSNENAEFYTTMIYPCLNRSVYLIELSTWWKFSFSLSGSSLMFWWCDTPRMREFQMWGRRCKHWDADWFQGQKNAFLWNMINHIVKTFHNTFSTNDFLQQLFHYGPPVSCLQHLVGSCPCHCLWITVESL